MKQILLLSFKLNNLLMVTVSILAKETFGYLAAQRMHS